MRRGLLVEARSNSASRGIPACRATSETLSPRGDWDKPEVAMRHRVVRLTMICQYTDKPEFARNAASGITVLAGYHRPCRLPL
jgi:hypothetical protein